MPVVFDPSRAKVDTAYRTEAMELYKQGKLQISDKDLKWLKEVTGTSADSTTYSIEDDEKTADDKTNIAQRKKGTDEAHWKTDLAISGSAMVASTAIGLSAASGATGAIAQMNACNSLATPIACITALAIGTKYMLTRPNKDEHHELEILKESMETGDIELANSKAEVERSADNIEEIAAETENVNNLTEEELKALQEELEKKQTRINELNTKAQSEEGLTEEEKAELEILTGEVQVLKEKMGTAKEEGVENAEDKQGEIEDEQDNVEEAQEVFNSVLDVANYAETFDEASKNAATLEAVAQGTNVALGLGAAAALTFHSPMLFLTPLGQIMRGMALAGAGMSAFGVGQQTVFAHDIGKEIDVRVDVQNNGTNAVEEAEETIANIENAAQTTSGVIENLEDIKEPEEEVPIITQVNIKEENKNNKKIPEDK